MKEFATNLLFIVVAMGSFISIAITADFLSKRKEKKTVKLTASLKRFFFRSKYFSAKINTISVCAVIIQAVNYGILLQYFILSVIGCLILNDATIINICQFSLMIYAAIVLITGITFGLIGRSRQIQSDKDINSKLY